MDESSKYISDTRPTAKQLWRPSLGVLELGIHGANNLLPMKTTKDHRGSTDAYCVAKYGQKWVRTRTIFESFNPRWNEQYTWEVNDPGTVITVGVFDNRCVLLACMLLTLTSLFLLHRYYIFSKTWNVFFSSWMCTVSEGMSFNIAAIHSI
jgi:hypothetical protein